MKMMRPSFIKCLESKNASVPELKEQYEMEAKYDNMRQNPPTPGPTPDPNAWREEAIRDKYHKKNEGSKLSLNFQYLVATLSGAVLTNTATIFQFQL